MNRYDGNQDQDDDTLDTLANKTSLAFLATLSLIVLLFARGVLLTLLWGAFISPTFGLPPLTLKQGLGIALFTGALLSFFSISNDTDDDDFDHHPTFDSLWQHNKRSFISMSIMAVLALIVYNLL